MKDHFVLNSKQNILRQAIMDLAVDQDRTTLAGLIDWQLEKGASIERLARFAVRRLGLTYMQAVSGISLLVPDRLN